MVGGAGDLPDVASDMGVFKQAAAYDLVGVVGDLLGLERRPFALVALADRVVDPLDLGEESTNDRVALPVAQPISRSRSPGLTPARATTSSNTASG